MNEKLRESLDTAMMFQKLMDTFRDVVEVELKNHPTTNDELSLLMATAYNGLGGVKVHLFNVVGILNERISWMGNDDGLEKLIPPLLSYDDGSQEYIITEEPQDEWHQSDASDEDEYRDEWEIEEDDYDDDGYNDSTPEK